MYIFTYYHDNHCIHAGCCILKSFVLKQLFVSLFNCDVTVFQLASADVIACVPLSKKFCFGTDSKKQYILSLIIAYPFTIFSHNGAKHPYLFGGSGQCVSNPDLAHAQKHPIHYNMTIMYIIIINKYEIHLTILRYVIRR